MRFSPGCCWCDQPTCTTCCSSVLTPQLKITITGSANDGKACCSEFDGVYYVDASAVDELAGCPTIDAPRCNWRMALADAFTVSCIPASFIWHVQYGKDGADCVMRIFLIRIVFGFGSQWVVWSETAADVCALPLTVPWNSCLSQSDCDFSGTTLTLEAVA